MRLYQTGFELDDDLTEDGVQLLLAERWTTNAATINNGWTIVNDGSEPFVHTNPQGLGGTNAISRQSTLVDATMWSKRFPFDFKEAWIGFAFKIPTADTSSLCIGNSLEGTDDLLGSQIQMVFQPDGSCNIWLGDDDSGSIAATENFLLTPGYHWFALQYRLDNSSGTFQLYADDTLYASFTGDTRGNASYDYWNRFWVSFGRGSALDDFLINGLTVTYTGGAGGSGSPTIGNTVTGGTSGATAVITSFEESSGDGFLVLENVSGNFSDAESISDGSGWTATSALVGGGSGGLDKNSGKPAETFIVLTRPNGTTAAGLTGSDGNSVDNHLQVNDDFTDESTYNSTTSAAEDLYTMENLPFSPDTVDAVEPVIYANRAGTIVAARTILDPGLGNTYSENLQIGSGGTSAKASKIYDVNPDTDSDWTEGTVNATDVGVRFVT